MFNNVSKTYNNIIEKKLRDIITPQMNEEDTACKIILTKTDNRAKKIKNACMTILDITVQRPVIVSATIKIPYK